ncbi:hypothetical protein WICPIJ_010060 [Wickerhamomyces pijperi]|uniref:Cleavage and polyadenylation specificity factor subunit 2 n=1 Tax=Wickerhamomyces pijperi TaxID=599730 RepID=A0A9P8PIQ6_WICPI|nr:hypothetical protein WICPIJ_010060 [Wickerhamomyces pijperi]
MGFRYTTVTPIGVDSATSTTTTNTRASILEFDGVRILADPGLSPLAAASDPQTLQQEIQYLTEILPTIDIILLSHPLTSLIGNYASLAITYAMKSGTGKLNIPVYSTQPTSQMGKVATVDLYRTLGLVGPILGSQFEISQIDEAFEQIQTVKYSQTLDLRGKFDGLTITALQAGHTLGGTIWVLTKNEERVTYAPEFNQARDSFLNGADLANSILLRSSVIVLGSKLGSTKAYKKRVESFLELVSATLGNGGTVFLPTSIGSRLLELIHLIDNHLQSAPIPVLLLAHSKAKPLSVAGTLQEWMSPQVMKQWETKLKIPFDSSKVDVIEPMDLINRQGAKVVFASGAAFETGSLAEEALRLLCSDPNTSVVLTERPSIGTVGHQLYEAWVSKTTTSSNSNSTTAAAAVDDGKVIGFEGTLQMSMNREDPLRNEDLAQFQALVKARREQIEKIQKDIKEAAEKAATANNAKKVEDESESESEDEDILAKTAPANGTDIQGVDANGNATKTSAESTNPIDVDLRSVKTRSKKMFPFIQNKKAKIDDYGMQLGPQQFVRVEEKPNFLKQKQSAFQQQQQRKKAVQLSNREKKKAHNQANANKNPWNEGKKQDDVAHLDPLTGNQPVRVTHIPTSIHAKCVLTYLDLEGLADLRTYLGLLTSIKPRNVILIPDQSNAQNIDRLTSSLSKIGKFEVIQALAVNEPIYPTSTVQALDFLMDEEFAKSLRWQRIADGYQVAHVVAGVMNEKEYKQLLKDRKVKEEEASGVNVKKKEGEEGQAEEEEQAEEEDVSSRKAQLHLTALPPATANSTAIRHIPLAIGDIKLPTLRRTLLQMDYKVEFKGEGTLVVDDCCVVRKLSDGEVIVDGVPGTVVKEVRAVVRGLLAYV